MKTATSNNHKMNEAVRAIASELRDYPGFEDMSDEEIGIEAKKLAKKMLRAMASLEAVAGDLVTVFYNVEGVDGTMPAKIIETTEESVRILYDGSTINQWIGRDEMSEIEVTEDGRRRFEYRLS